MSFYGGGLYGSFWGRLNALYDEFYATVTVGKFNFGKYTPTTASENGQCWTCVHNRKHMNQCHSCKRNDRKAHQLNYKFNTELQTTFNNPWEKVWQKK